MVTVSKLKWLQDFQILMQTKQVKLMCDMQTDDSTMELVCQPWKHESAEHEGLLRWLGFVHLDLFYEL